MLFVVLVSTTMSLASPPAPASGGPISFRLDVMPVFMASQLLPPLMLLNAPLFVAA